MFRAIAFDLGDTLFFSDVIPLNWAKHYPAALAAVGVPCGMPLPLVQRDLAHVGIGQMIDLLLTSTIVRRRQPIREVLRISETPRP